MTIWVDAHLSPAIATWITNTLGITVVALRDIGLGVSIYYWLLTLSIENQLKGCISPKL